MIAVGLDFDQTMFTNSLTNLQNTDRSEQTKLLEKLLVVAVSPYARIRVLLALISALLDYNPSMNSHMPLDSWAAARNNVDLLLDTLTKETQYVVREEAPDYDDLDERAPSATEPTIIVRGSVISLVDRLDDEFTKSLQNIDPHTGEYIDRLKDEKKIYETLVKAQVYFEQVQLTENLDRVLMRRLEHIYCKVSTVFSSLSSTLFTVSFFLTYSSLSSFFLARRRYSSSRSFPP